MTAFFNRHKIAIILGLIVVAGIFLRTYQFRDWLQFSPDQARDATIIRDVIEKGMSLPLSGPQAGNTSFSLGPLYYHFQYVSGVLFGVSPEAMAYSDVFFSILAIPLLFFFLRNRFSDAISLWLTAIMSVSYFSVLNSRFASNPNSIPFFLTLFLFGLYGMLRTSNDSQRYWRFVWPAMVGIGMGVGVQQHTLLLVTMPVVALAVVILLWRERRFSWRSLLIALALTLVLNGGFLVHEWQTDGQSTRALFKGISNRSEGNSKFVKNAGLIASCELQANAHIISSLQEIEVCGKLFSVSREIKKNGHSWYGRAKSVLLIGGIALNGAFTLGGLFLGWRAYRRTRNHDQKRFLALLAGFNAIMFLAFIPVAGEVGMRYFIVLFFVPFVLLGLWMEFFVERYAKRGMWVASLLALMLIVSSGVVVFQAGKALAYGKGSDVDNSILGELDPMLNYIFSRADPSQTDINISGKKMYYKRFFKPLNFLAQEKAGKSLHLADKKNQPKDDEQVFLFSNSTKKKHRHLPGSYTDGHLVEDSKAFGNIMITVVRW
jgi:4-amino-4-deoxy-L-arabinose transferase-like glycosyltransferase